MGKTFHPSRPPTGAADAGARLRLLSRQVPAGLPGTAARLTGVLPIGRFPTDGILENQMIADARDAALYHDFGQYPELDAVRRAFEMLVGVAATSTRFDGSIRYKGKLREFSFRRGDTVHYGVSVNRKWLKFWFCPPAVNSGKHSPDALAEAFPSFEGSPNSGDEWVVKLNSVADVEALLRHVDLT